MFVLDTANFVKGLKNTEQMDMKMAEMIKKKKTRRGKKNRMRKSQGNTSDVFSTLDSRSFYVKRGQYNRKFIRPTSPKAPMNSTQFLIEDRGNDHLEIENNGCNNSPAFHGLSPEREDFTYESFYHTENDRKHQDTDGEVEYMPIDFEDTADFIDQEFEKDFNSHYTNCLESDNITTTFEAMSTKTHNVKRRELAKVPKYTLVKRMLELEDKLLMLEKDAERSSQNNLKMRIQQLQEENSALKSENELLRNYLS